LHSHLIPQECLADETGSFFGKFSSSFNALPLPQDQKTETGDAELEAKNEAEKSEEDHDVEGGASPDRPVSMSTPTTRPQRTAADKVQLAAQLLKEHLQRSTRDLPVVETFLESFLTNDFKDDGGRTEERSTDETKGDIRRITTSDHRQGTSGNKAIAHATHWLNEAVRSIPAYIERSSLMIVLVPPAEHSDRPGEICDYSNWRRRGWCRLELAGAALARTNVRVMIVKVRRGW
jgi:hypothetical protein